MTSGSVSAMWRQLDFPLLHDEPNGLAPFLESLRPMYTNGSVVHRAFSFPEHPDLRQYTLHAARHGDYFFERFWRSASVHAALPHALHEADFLDKGLFKPTLPVELPGSLAGALIRGGAYTCDTMPARQAMALGSAAAEALLAGDFDDALLFVSHAAWSHFFCGVAWDHTWIVMQPAQARIDVVLATDTD